MVTCIEPFDCHCHPFDAFSLVSFFTHCWKSENIYLSPPLLQSRKDKERPKQKHKKRSESPTSLTLSVAPIITEKVMKCLQGVWVQGDAGLCAFHILYQHCVTCGIQPPEHLQIIFPFTKQPVPNPHGGETNLKKRSGELSEARREIEHNFSRQSSHS